MRRSLPRLMSDATHRDRGWSALSIAAFFLAENALLLLDRRRLGWAGWTCCNVAYRDETTIGSLRTPLPTSPLVASTRCRRRTSMDWERKPLSIAYPIVHSSSWHEVLQDPSAARTAPPWRIETSASFRLAGTGVTTKTICMQGLAVRVTMTVTTLHTARVPAGTWLTDEDRYFC